MTDCHFQPNPSDVISVKTGNGNTYNFNVATVLAYASANNLGNSFVFFGSYSNGASIYFFNSSQTVGHFGTPSYIRYSTEYADYYWGFEQNLGLTPGSRRSYDYNMSNGTISSSSSISLTFNSKTVDDVTYYVSKPNWEYQNPSIIIYVGSLQTVVIDNVVPDMNQSGGAGSGYIGNSLLSNKKMVGYNVPTSSAEATKTESVDEASENPVSGKPKIGNGFARIKFLRNLTDFVLIDSYNNYHSPIVDLSNTGFKDGNQTTRWQYLQDGTFESFDDSQAQTKCVFNTKMKKGSAVNLCIECTTENVFAYPDFGFGLMPTMPTEWGYPSGGNRGTVLKWLYDFATTTKGTYELSLDDISSDTEFYLCFYNNSTENIVYKVWFEGIPEYTQYDEWWLQPSGDTQVPIKVYGTDTPLVLTINEIMQDLQAAGYNSVLFYPENTGNYIMCAFSIANPTDSLYLSGKSVSIYDENTTYITSWSASGAPDSQRPNHFENCYRYYISGGVRRLDRAGVTHNASGLYYAEPYVATDTGSKDGSYPRIYYTSVQINHLYVDGKEIYQG